MGECAICGLPAGLFRSNHRKCVADRKEALDRLPLVLTGYIGLSDEQANVDGIKRVFEKISDLAQLDPTETQQRARDGLHTAIGAAMADGTLTDQEVRRLNEVVAALDADFSNIDESVKNLLIQGLILQDLRKGVVRSRIAHNNELPIALKSSEQLLWFSAPATRMETKVRTRYVGVSHGFSFRIMRGVSYRVGSSAGEPIQTTSLVNVGDGGLAMTNLALYFLSTARNYRLPAKSIVTIEAYSDGICVTPSRGKSQIFLTKDPQFWSALVKSVGALN